MVSLLLPSLITCGGGGGEGWIEEGWGGEKEGGGGKGEERMDVCMEGEGEGKGGRERRREGMDGWMDGWREGTGGWKGGKGEEGMDKYACTHAHMHTHTCMHAPMHTHTSSSSASEICGVGRISLLHFLASLALQREGHTFTSRHTRLADSMYVHMYTLYSTYVQYVHNV